MSLCVWKRCLIKIQWPLDILHIYTNFLIEYLKMRILEKLKNEMCIHKSILVATIWRTSFMKNRQWTIIHLEMNKLGRNIKTGQKQIEKKHKSCNPYSYFFLNKTGKRNVANLKWFFTEPPSKRSESPK